MVSTYRSCFLEEGHCSPLSSDVHPCCPPAAMDLFVIHDLNLFISLGLSAETLPHKCFG